MPGQMTESSFFAPVDGLTVWQAFQRTAQRLPDKTAVVEGDRRLTFAELADRADRLSAGLAGMGLGRGDMVAVYLRNSIELVALFYALQRLGVSIAWINPDYREKELRHILSDSGARALFTMEEWEEFSHLALVRSLRADLPRLELLVALPASSGGLSGADDLVSLEGLMSGPPASAGLGADASADDLAMLLYTSGTTGQPKGAMIKQSQVLRGGLAYSYGVEAGEDDIFIAFLSLSHSYGCGALLVQPFILGATTVILPRFSAEAAFALIEREKVTLQLAAPAHYLLELRHARRGDYDLSSIRAGLSAGQIAPPGLISQVEDEMGIYITSFLGASEVGPGLSIMLPPGSPRELRETYIGYPIFGTEVRVADPVTGEELPAGESGELLLSGWHVMAGYWNNPQATQDQLRDGWLHTGDLVRREENGLVQIQGRLKDCINRGGFKVIPSELERVLIEHPDVEEVCVVGTPNPILGEGICACVVPREGEQIDLHRLRGFLKEKVADNKLPDELLVFEQFPRLSGGLKVNRYGAGGVAEAARTATQKQTLR
jgi:acyl-CoA synthetase (AMP-forming)/AMP-acid ligase II